MTTAPLTRNIVLTGFMGTGKTTVGRIVAGQLGFDFVDTDEIIEERHGPIPEIFAEQGEAAFREYETAVANELAQRNSLVISTGGRLMLDATNAAALKTTGSVFCLAADVDEVVRRLVGDGVEHRPLLSTSDPEVTIRTLLRERADLYGAFDQVDTTGRTPESIAAEIIERRSTY